MSEYMQTTPISWVVLRKKYTHRQKIINLMQFFFSRKLVTDFHKPFENVHSINLNVESQMGVTFE